MRMMKSNENERICHLAHLSAIWHIYLAHFALVLVLYAPLREEEPVQPQPALSERLQFSGEPQAPGLRVRTTPDSPLRARRPVRSWCFYGLLSRRLQLRNALGQRGDNAPVLPVGVALLIESIAQEGHPFCVFRNCISELYQ